MLVRIMVTSCAVVGCARRHAKGEKRSLWIAALRRKNADGSDWIPGEGDRVCGDHFTTGAPHKDPSHPDYVPSVAMGYDSPHAASKVVPGQSQSRQSLGRFDRAQQRREARISLAAEAAEDAKRAQHLLHVQQKRVQQEHCYATCDSEPESAAKRLRPPGDQILQTGGENVEIPVEVEVNTDWTIHPLSCENPYAKVAQLEEKLDDMEKQKKVLHEQVTSMANQTTFGVHLIKDNDKKTRFYTGLPVYGVFVALLTYLQTKAVKLREWRGEHETSAEYSSRGQKPWATIPVAEQFFSVLVRLRLGLRGQDIADRMGIPEGTFSKLFSTWIIFLSRELTLLFPWPSRKQIDSWMPRSFCQKYPSTIIILDCMEVQVQRPSRLLGQSQTFSHYKSRNTFKLLVGISPSGLITFLSPLWGGRVSDREIVQQSMYGRVCTAEG